MKEQKDKFYRQSVATILVMLVVTIVVYAVDNVWLMRGWLGLTLVMYIVSEAAMTMLRLSLIDAVEMLKEQDKRVTNLFKAILTPDQTEMSKKELLEESLNNALAEENYELASKLRDALANLNEE